MHSYYDAALGFSFVNELLEKLYKIMHTLSVFFSEILAVPLVRLHSGFWFNL